MNKMNYFQGKFSKNTEGVLDGNKNKKLFLYLTLTFIVATVVGTLSHEFGHYIVAKSLGYDADIHYAFTTWDRDDSDALTDSADSNNIFYILIGGPIQTMLTGSIGLILLYVCRQSFQDAKQLSLKQWTIVFMSLFWLRQTANFVVWISKFLLTGNFSTRSDEVVLAKYLHIPSWTITSATAVIGVGVLVLILTKFMPREQRRLFILAGLVGGITGYILWLNLLGEMIMP